MGIYGLIRLMFVVVGAFTFSKYFFGNESFAFTVAGIVFMLEINRKDVIGKERLNIYVVFCSMPLVAMGAFTIAGYFFGEYSIIAFGIATIVWYLDMFKEDELYNR